MPGTPIEAVNWLTQSLRHNDTIDGERLIKLSEGSCDHNDVAGILDRIVAVSLTGGEAEKAPARDAR